MDQNQEDLSRRSQEAHGPAHPRRAERVCNRRAALRHLTARPFKALGDLIEERSHLLEQRCTQLLHQFRTELTLVEYNAQVFSGESQLVTRILAQRRPALEAIIAYVPSETCQREARELLAQALLLRAWLGFHRGEDPHQVLQVMCQALFTCERKVAPALEYAILRRMAWLYETIGDGAGALEVMEQALEMLHEDEEQLQQDTPGQAILPTIRACIYAGVARAQAQAGQEITRSYLERAREAFSGPACVVNVPVYLPYHRACLLFDEGMCAYYQGDYVRALATFSEILDFKTHMVKAYLPSQFARAAVANRALLAMLQLQPEQREREQIMALFHVGFEYTRKTQSVLRYRELAEACRLFERAWPESEEHAAFSEVLSRFAPPTGPS
jgi:tetratricopeptide (TPR) repeat protein